MPTNKLTDSQAKAAKAKERPYKLSDGEGMYLYVTPTGAKVWRLAYRIGGLPQTMSFGPYPEVTLAKAREKRDEAKKALRDGADPMAPRRASRAGLTFKAACETYWAGRKDLSASYVSLALRGLELHLWPALGGQNIASLGRDDLLEPLNAMDAAGLHVYVRKVRMWASQVFDWAIEQGHAKINPAASINPKKAFAVAKVEHFPSVPLSGVGPMLQRLAMEGELQSVLACRFLACTWVRTNEMRGMLWSELDGPLWRIGAKRMKRKRDHLVPLPKQALAIIETMRSRSRGSVYVFPSDHRTDRPMSENAVTYLLHRIGYKGKHSGHGWRSVASTWANENGYSPDAIERQLAHAPDDKVRAAYNHAAYLPERKAMLQAYADWLDQLEAGGFQS